MKRKKIFIIAGEKSGDLLGAKIIKNLDKTKFELYGVGGKYMEKMGVKSLFPISNLSIMGIFELLPKLFQILKLIKMTVNFILKIKPDIILTIDSPDFCFRVIAEIKKKDMDNKIKKIHLIAPSVWAYRKGRAKQVSKIYDLLFCILPFEKDIFLKQNLETIFVGHPMFYKESIEYSFNKKENKYNENSNKITITIGSRIMEIKRFLPIIQEVILKLDKTFKSKYKYCFLATDDTEQYIQDKLVKNKNVTIITNDKKKMIAVKNSVIGITKSGTNTLEFSAFSIPIIVFYKFGFLTNLFAMFLRKINNFKYANLLNIIENKEIIPEFILNKCNANSIYKTVVKFLKNKNIRKKQLHNIRKPLEKIGFNQNYSIKKIIDEIVNNL